MKSIYLYFEILCFCALAGSLMARIRKDSSFNEKFQFLSDESRRNALIRINSDRFRNYVKSSPRNYSIIVLFNAMAPHRLCALCQEANNEFQIVVNSFRYSEAFTNKLFFGVVDLDESYDVFSMMKLKAAPAFIHFPPKGKLKPSNSFDILKLGINADIIVKWIAEQTNVHIKVLRPYNYYSTSAFITTLTVLIGFLFIRRDSVYFSKFKNKTLWAVNAMIFTLVMVSGQMWNHIRSPPFFFTTHNGINAYIYKSAQAQFLLETYIIIIFNGLIALGMILMTEAKKNKGNTRKRKTLALVGMFLFTTCFGLLLVIFHIKADENPYSFLYE